MRYRYNYRLLPADLWKLMMEETYRSLAGMCNLVFTAAMIALTWNRWSMASVLWRGLLVAACLWFPLIHPLIMFQRAKKQAAKLTHDMELAFGDIGVQIRIGEERSLLKWKQIKGFTRKKTALIVYTDSRHGYILSNRILGNDKDGLYDYAYARLNENI